MAHYKLNSDNLGLTMTTEKTIKVKKTSIPAKTMGAIKRHPLHMSLDELIQYKTTGVQPKIIISEDILFRLGEIGASLKNTAQVLNVTEETISSNAPLLSAWQKGRANVGTKVRALIVEDALNGNLQAKIYLDKMLGGDTITDNLNVTVTAQPLKEVSTEQLLEFTLIRKNDDAE